jgi:hypothetical protein
VRAEGGSVYKYGGRRSGFIKNRRRKWERGRGAWCKQAGEEAPVSTLPAFKNKHVSVSPSSPFFPVVSPTSTFPSCIHTPLHDKELGGRGEAINRAMYLFLLASCPTVKSVSISTDKQANTHIPDHPLSRLFIILVSIGNYGSIHTHPHDI